MSGLLSDSELLRLRHTLIEPFDAKCVQPASYDLSLHSEALALPDPGVTSIVDLRTDDPRSLMRPVELGEGYDLIPGACLIASTVEVIRCPDDIAARVEGKSSLGRLFLSVHTTAGWIDPGWRGQVTLELVNHAPWAITLWRGMKIAQINFTRMESPCAVPYGAPHLGSHYQGQQGPTAAIGRRSLEQNGIQAGVEKKVGK